MTPQVISLSAAGTTAWIPVDYKQNPYNISLSVVLSNTPTLTYKVEYTLDDIFNSAITPTAFTHSTLTDLTANATGSITTPVRAIRLNVTAWTAGTVTLTALQGVLNPTIYTTNNNQVKVFKFLPWPSNTGFLLASLVVGSTAVRTSNIVTVTATAHGITTGTTYVGYRFYYPGSPSLVAGWYDSILTIPDANTITFYASGTDFGSESVNFGAAWVTYTDFATIPLPARTLKDGSIVTLVCYRDGGGTLAFKYVSLYLSNSPLGINYNTTSPKSLYRSGFICIGTAKQIATQSITDNTPATALYTTTKDITVDQIITLKGQVTGAGDFIAIGHAHLEIIQ